MTETPARIKEALGAVRQMGRTLAGNLKDAARACKNLRAVDGQISGLTQQIATASGAPETVLKLADDLRAACQRRAAMEEKVLEIEGLAEQVERELAHHAKTALEACEPVFRMVASAEALQA